MLKRVVSYKYWKFRELVKNDMDVSVSILIFNFM